MAESVYKVIEAIGTRVLVSAKPFVALMMSRIAAPLKDWVSIIKRNVHAIASRDAHANLASRDVDANFASRDPRWYANVLAIVVVWIDAIAIVAASIVLAYRHFAA